MRREHELDRQLEQRPQLLEDLLAGDAPAQPLVQREARSKVGERVARDDRADTLDPQDEVIVLAACVRLDPEWEPVVGRVPVGVSAAAAKPLQVWAAVTGLLGGDGVLSIRSCAVSGGGAKTAASSRSTSARVSRSCHGAVRTITGSRFRASVSSATGTASGSKSSKRSPSSIAYDDTSCGHRWPGVHCGCGACQCQSPA